MRRNLLDDLEKIKTDWEKVRFILLIKNFTFNQKLKQIRREKDKDLREEKLEELCEHLRLPITSTYLYMTHKRPFLRDFEIQQSLYFVYDTAMGPKNVIDKDGIYIKFDPDKPDIYYKRLIRQLRSNAAWLRAPSEIQQTFIKRSGSSPYHFLGKKKAKTRRSQHGFNFKQDMKVYFECEKSIMEIFTISAKDMPVSLSKEQEKEYNEKFIKHALNFVAEELEMNPAKVKRIYYEVCTRYKLPTLTKDPTFP